MNRASIEPGRIAIGQTWRQLEIVRATKGLEAGADALIEIARGWSLRLLERALQDAPGLGLHRVTVLGRADAQPLFDRWVKVTDRDAAHVGASVCMRSLIINDRIDVRLALLARVFAEHDPAATAGRGERRQGGLSANLDLPGAGRAAQLL